VAAKRCAERQTRSRIIRVAKRPHAGKILAHIGDLYDWALSIVSGNQVWKDSRPLPWEKEVERFFASLKKFDNYLASGNEMHETAAALFQGPSLIRLHTSAKSQCSAAWQGAQSKARITTKLKSPPVASAWNNPRHAANSS